MSVGGSAATGIQAGFDMGLRATAQEDARKQREFENTRQATQDQQRADQITRQNAQLDKNAAEHDDDRALTGATSALDDARYQLGALHAKYGDKPIPDAEAKPLYESVGKTFKTKQDLLAKRYQPVVDQTQQKWRDFASKAEAGQADPSTLRGQDLRDFIKATTGHDLSDFAGGTVGGAINDATAGLESKNTSLAIRAAGTLLGPQIKQGLGGTAPDGSTIINKDLYALVPAPSSGMQPGQQAPVAPLKGLMDMLNGATAAPMPAQGMQPGQNAPMQPSPAGAAAMGAGPQPGQDPNASAGGGTLTPGSDPSLLMPVLEVTTRQPDGRITTYHAPVTKNRGTDADDALAKPLQMSELLDRMGRLGVVDNWLKTPQMADAVKEALANGPTTFEQAWGMVHGDPKALSNVANDPTSKKIAAIKQFAKENDIDFESAARMIAAKGETGVQAKLTAIGGSNLSDAEKKTAERVALGVQKIATPKAGSTGTSKAGTGSAALGGAPAPADTSAKAVDFWSRAVIAGDKDWQVGLSRSKTGAALIEAVKRRVPEMAGEMGLDPQDIGTARAQNAALGATMKDLTKRSEAVDLFASKVEKDMKTFDTMLTKAGSDSPLLINKPLNILRRQFSDSDLAQLDLAAKQVGTEYERLITGGTLSVAQLHSGASEDAKKLINGDMPPKQARAVMEIMRTEMQNARDAAHESTTRIADKMRNLGRGSGPAAGPAPVAGTGIQGGAPAPAALKAPPVGTIIKGFRFKGGDPAQQANWEKAQ